MTATLHRRQTMMKVLRLQMTLQLLQLLAASGPALPRSSCHQQPAQLLLRLQQHGLLVQPLHMPL